MLLESIAAKRVDAPQFVCMNKNPVNIFATFQDVEKLMGGNAIEITDQL